MNNKIQRVRDQQAREESPLFSEGPLDQSEGHSCFKVNFSEGCLSPLHLVVFLGFHLIPKSQGVTFCFFTLINCL